jgi:hypothetical protein
VFDFRAESGGALALPNRFEMSGRRDLGSTGQRNSLIEYVWPRKLGIGRRGRNLPQSSAQQLSFHPTHQLQRPRALRMTGVRKKRFEQSLLRLVDDQRLHAFFRAQDG